MASFKRCRRCGCTEPGTAIYKCTTCGCIYCDVCGDSNYGCPRCAKSADVFDQALAMSIPFNLDDKLGEIEDEADESDSDDDDES